MSRYTHLAAALLSAFLLVGPVQAAPAIPTVGHSERVFAFDGAMPTGVTVSEDGRTFVNFPRWGDNVPYSVVELRDGKAVPYPDAASSAAYSSVQSVVADGHGRLWILDTAAPGFASPTPGGPRLVAVDLRTNQVVKTLVFPAEVILPSTYVNDMRFDLRSGPQGTVYVTDSSLSGPGAIIVMDIASGKALRRLSGDRSTAADPAFTAVIEGQELRVRGADGGSQPFAVASDGIALSPDGATLYYSAVSTRHLYSVPTALLRDAAVSENALSRAVRDLGEKGASDGLEADAGGAVYAGDYEHNSIVRRAPDGSWRTIAQGPALLWPDTLSIGPDGYLYFIVNQLHRQPGFHGGRDLRSKPYGLMRVRIDAAPAPTR